MKTSFRSEGRKLELFSNFKLLQKNLEMVVEDFVFMLQKCVTVQASGGAGMYAFPAAVLVDYIKYKETALEELLRFSFVCLRLKLKIYYWRKKCTKSIVPQQPLSLL